MRLVAFVLLVAALGVPANADTEVTGFVATGSGELTGVVTDGDNKPLRNIKVHIAPKGAPEQVVTTDEHGRYRATLPKAETTYVFVEKHVKLGGQVATNVVEGDAEAIAIHEALPPAVLPKPKTAIDYVPDYSDTAEDKNTWTRAWLLLYVDDTGKVAHLKLLDKPGLDLDKIAIREGFDVRFEPARDRAGNKIAAMVLWTFEWPAFYWMIDHKRSIHRLPPEVGGVQCRNTAPAKALRDCSKPSIANAVSQPWIDRPAQ